MKIVLFGFHKTRGRSVIQRMPDMLAHMEKGAIMARPKREKELARSKAVQNEIHECISQIFEMRKEIAEMAGDYHGSVETYRKQKR